MNKYLILILTITFNWPAEKIFIACEGNFYEGNGSLWTISNDTVIEFPDNPIGDVVQSLLVFDNQLFAVVNGSGYIQVYNISETGLTFFKQIETVGSGPREIAIYNSYLYFTNWNSANIKKLNLNTLEIDSEIAMPGLPEDILMYNNLLYISITMNEDWTDGNQVISLDPNTDTILQSYNVGDGPGELLAHEGNIFVSRTYYDELWNAYYGTSKIKPDGDVIIVNYGSGTACGGGIYSLNNAVYRIYDGGIAMLDDELQIMPETRLGSYNPWEVYSAEVVGDYIYFGLSDYIAPDEIAVINLDGDEVARYEVGVLPGDFAVWNDCIADGDVNFDSLTNILDIVQIVEFIITVSDYVCHADMNNDNLMNILDIIILVELILD